MATSLVGPEDHVGAGGCVGDPLELSIGASGIPDGARRVVELARVVGDVPAAPVASDVSRGERAAIDDRATVVARSDERRVEAAGRALDGRLHWTRRRGGSAIAAVLECAPEVAG